MRHILMIGALALLAACMPAQDTPPPAAPVVTDAPAGPYTLDPAHADVSFRVSHIGFSMYTARFSAVDAVLQFDPTDPQAMSVAATIDVSSLTLPAPPPGFAEEMLGPNWFDAVQFPQISFRSTGVERTGANTARIHGELTLHGITKPIVLEANFNGGYAGHPLEPRGRIGLSAHSSFKRSDFGVSFGIPAPGSTMGVGDEVEVIIEAEFSGPPWAGAAAMAP